MVKENVGEEAWIKDYSEAMGVLGGLFCLQDKETSFKVAQVREGLL